MADPDKEPRFNGKMDGGHAPTGKSRSPYPGIASLDEGSPYGDPRPLQKRIM